MNVEKFRKAIVLELEPSLVEDKKRFVYLIGSEDHFDSIEDLVEFYSANEGLVSFYGSEGPRNSSRYEVEAADADTALLLGYGLAFKDDWCRGHTVSILLKGE